MTNLLLDDYVTESSGDYFEVLFNKAQTVVEATEFFRREYEFFRGEPIESRIRDASVSFGIISEREVGKISVFSLNEFSPSESFRLKSWNHGNTFRRFYDSLQRKFE